MTTTNDLLDHDLLRELVELLGAGLDPVLEQFTTQVQELATEIGHAAGGDEVTDVGTLAHRLKGSAGSVGARRLGAEAAQLERLAREGDGAGVRAAVEQLPALVSRTVQELQVFLRESRSQRGA